MFAIMCHNCYHVWHSNSFREPGVTYVWHYWLLTYVKLITNYQLLLITYIINYCYQLLLSMYVFYMYTSEYVRHIM